MKRFTAILVCILTLTLASCANPITPNNTPSSTPTPSTDNQAPLKTMLSPTSSIEKYSDWTALGEVGYIIDGDYYDLRLLTDAEQSKDGDMIWDDSQNWALVAVGENKSYLLYNARLSGMAYMNVTTSENLPIITLIIDTPTGIGAKKYTYSDGSFYEENVITPENNGNSIFSSFPEYDD